MTPGKESRDSRRTKMFHNLRHAVFTQSRAWLGRPGELDGLVQRFRCDVRPVRPHDRAPVNKESLEVALILQRLENRPFEPALKIDRALHVVTEREMNAKTTLVLGPNDGWQEVHRRN